jgi:hypothetical protein
MSRSKSTLFTIAALATGGLLAAPGAAQAQVYTPGYAPQYAPQYAPGYSYQPAPQVASYYYALTPGQLDEILAPIALYPDPLLASVLAASTYPQQLNQVAISLRANPNIDDNYINAQPWPDAVKVLAHYPDLITFMTARPDWTLALGAVFVEQQADVMNTIQRLRQEAQDCGTLYTTQQQQVVVNNNYIQILPAQPNVVYVPQYDPQVVYVRGRAPRDAIRFSGALRVTPNLVFDFDWAHHDLGVGARWDRGRPDHGRDFHPWQHDEHFGPRPVLPPAAVNRFNNDARRGYVPPPPGRAVFNNNDNRDDVRRAVERAQQSRPPQVFQNRGPSGPGDWGRNNNNGRFEDRNR